MLPSSHAEALPVWIVCGDDQIVDQICLGDDVATAILKRAQPAAVDQLVNRVFAKGRPADDLARRQHVGRAAQELRVLLA